MPTVIHFVGGESVVVTAEIDRVRAMLLAEPWVQVEFPAGTRAHVNSAQVTHLVERAERGERPGMTVYPERRQSS
jgi:hypothetical protein